MCVVDVLTFLFLKKKVKNGGVTISQFDHTLTSASSLSVLRKPFIPHLHIMPDLSGWFGSLEAF